MATEITTRQCPACTGPLHFVGESGRLECDYCGKSYTVDEIEALYAAKDAAAEAKLDAKEKAAAEPEEAGEAPEAAEAEITDTPWDFSETGSKWEEDAAGVSVYNCPSCGAELICDSTTAATSCPYCGNNTIVPGKLGGALKPDYVIPFKLDKQAAVAALKRHYRKKILLPGSFTSGNHIEEIQGVYVPFWLFDGEVYADVDFDATVSTTVSEKDRDVITTRHYTCNRTGTLAFQRLPVDASTKMPDDHMDSIEPYDYSELKPFSTSYLPGFLADKYDVTPKKSAKRADKRAAQSASDALQETVKGYDGCSEMSRSVQMTRGKVKYALLPVWVLNTKWQDKDFLFAMNGQTGKLVGDLPISKAKSWGLFAAVYAVFCALTALAALYL